MGTPWTKEMVEYVRAQVAAGIHPRRFYEEFCKKFGNQYSVGAIEQKCKRDGISYAGLPVVDPSSVPKLAPSTIRHHISAEQKQQKKDDEAEYKRLLDERVRKQEQRELKQLREQKALNDRLLSMADKKIVKIKPVKFQPTHKKLIQTRETFGALLSDTHFGEVIDKDRTNGLNEYNFKIAVDRIEHYANTIVQLATRTFQGYQFDKLVIWMLGDMVSGRIHEELIETQDLDCVEQVFDGAQLIAGYIAHLLPHFKQLEVVCDPGNHGRHAKKKAHKQPHYNWDYFLYRTVQNILINEQRISWNVTKSASSMTSVEGWNFYSTHGDSIKSWMNLPHYGIQRMDYRKSAALAAIKQFYRYLLLAHFHSEAKLPRPGGKTIINGSVSGVNEYAWDELGEFSYPEQKIFSVHAKQGITLELTVNLADHVR